ncbi:TrmB family transcriptional regulator [Halomarina pelagica]|uniref:TrmB family transcriptional regulator n=1 Tax=Halomarina pelagica TaxID=2961599 RepID=UPI0020C228E9|nr:TrmB family transcriptional regulator [Halomarina sp. BND7]
MDTETLRETLEGTGLTQYEADAYIAVLELGSAPATEISDTCGVPQARIYDVLRNLQRKGFVETYQQGSLHARAHEPNRILDDLTSYAETVTEAAAEIRERWERPTIENHRVSVLKPLSSILDRARESIERAEDEVKLAVTPEEFEALEEALATAYERDVTVKLALTPDTSGERAVEDLDFDGVATEVRYRDLPTPLLVLVDRMHVCFAPEKPLHPTHEYSLLVNDYSFSRLFDWYFATALWWYWTPVYSARDETLPRTYTSIRECIRDIDRFSDANEVVVTVLGKERGSETDLELTGRVVDVEYAGGDMSEPLLATFVERATIWLETDDGTYEVGGWGALFEEIEGRRFVVEAID